MIENKTNLALRYKFPVSEKFNFDFTIQTAAIEKLMRRMPGRKSGHNGGREAKVFQIICLRQQAERLRNVMPFVFLLRIYPQKFSTARSRRARAICRSTTPAPRVAQKFTERNWKWNERKKEKKSKCKINTFDKSQTDETCENTFCYDIMFQASRFYFIVSPNRNREAFLCFDAGSDC